VISSWKEKYAIQPYNSYKRIDEVLGEFGINYTEQNFIHLSETQVPDYFKSEIDLTLKEGMYKNSEYALCETLIYPTLRELWKHYKTDLLLWSHQPLNYDENLCMYCRDDRCPKT